MTANMAAKSHYINILINNVEGVAKNSVKAEMSWMEVGTVFINTLKFINYTSTATLWQNTVL